MPERAWGADSPSSHPSDLGIFFLEEHMSEQVSIGCQMLKDTLVEVGPSVTSAAP